MNLSCASSCKLASGASGQTMRQRFSTSLLRTSGFRLIPGDGIGTWTGGAIPVQECRNDVAVHRLELESFCRAGQTWDQKAPVQVHAGLRQSAVQLLPLTSIRLHARLATALGKQFNLFHQRMTAASNCRGTGGLMPAGAWCGS